MAQNTQSMVENANILEQNFVNLNQLLNNSVAYGIDIEDVALDKGLYKNFNYNKFNELIDNPTLREPFIEFLTQEAINNAPEIKSLSYNLEATNNSIKLNSSGRYIPTVSLQGQYNRSFNQWGKGSTPEPILKGNYNVGLNMSLPIFNRNQNTINKATYIIQKEQLELNKENTKLSIAVNIQNSVLNLVTKVSNISLSEVSETAAKESLELTQASYTNGSVNIVELIDAQNNFLNAQLSKNNATYNYLMSTLQLERYLGYYFLLNSEEDNNNFSQRFLEFLNTK